MTQIDENELLPCPFCGSDEIAHDSTVECDYIYCTECDCGTHAYKRGSGEALRAWNTRAPRTITREEFERAGFAHMDELRNPDCTSASLTMKVLATLGITVEGV